MRIQFERAWNDHLPDGRTVHYKAGPIYTVTKDIGSRAVASGRAAEIGRQANVELDPPSAEADEAEQPATEYPELD